MDLHVDDEQLAQVLAALKPTAKSSPDVSPFLQNFKLIVEIAAIVIAGTWVLFNYKTFQGELNRLAVKQAELTNQLTAEQTKRKLQPSISIDPKVETRKLKSPAAPPYWEVEYSYDISITSERDTSIAFVFLEWYIGTLDRGSAQFVRDNDPEVPGPIRWESCGVEVHIDQAKAPKVPNIEEHLRNDLGLQKKPSSYDILLLKDDEGGVGTYQSAEIVRQNRKFSVADQPNRWVGFRLGIGVVQEDGHLEIYYSKKSRSLMETAPKEGAFPTAPSVHPL